jgi:hypothetical protein
MIFYFCSKLLWNVWHSSFALRVKYRIFNRQTAMKHRPFKFASSWYTILYRFSIVLKHHENIQTYPGLLFQNLYKCPGCALRTNYIGCGNNISQCATLHVLASPDFQYKTANCFSNA